MPGGAPYNPHHQGGAAGMEQPNPDYLKPEGKLEQPAPAGYPGAGGGGYYPAPQPPYANVSSAGKCRLNNCLWFHAHALFAV